MADCRQCADFEWCAEHEDCGLFKPRKPVTNYDRIVSKSPEEMAAWIAEHPVVSEFDENNPKHKAWRDWLKQEAKE